MQKELLQRQQEHSWNLTTKGFSNSCDTGNFGCKGEAIAAISTICDVSIATRPSGTAEGFSMVVSPRAAAVRQVSSAAGNQVTPPAVITAANRAFSGTTVVVTNIFHNIPVRRASIRKQQEVQAVENFIRQVSLLFHEVEFAVLDRGSSSSGSEGRYFIHYSPVESVASRLTAAHGEVTLSKMTVRVVSLYLLCNAMECCAVLCHRAGWLQLHLLTCGFVRSTVLYVGGAGRDGWLCSRGTDHSS